LRAWLIPCTAQILRTLTSKLVNRRLGSLRTGHQGSIPFRRRSTTRNSWGRPSRATGALAVTLRTRLTEVRAAEEDHSRRLVYDKRRPRTWHSKRRNCSTKNVSGRPRAGRAAPDSVAGVGGFELPEDDSSNSHQLPKKGLTTLAAFTPIRQVFQSDGQNAIWRFESSQPRQRNI
jgi:hypothetical protein